mmetsp:Transcript_18541/g.43564  ORF Transcript_18541/g.43564 Transcript_18541/m.43564 type:complete len:426 (-) Transcript_18541:290-1567(-)
MHGLAHVLVQLVDCCLHRVRLGDWLWAALHLEVVEAHARWACRGCLLDARPLAVHACAIQPLQTSGAPVAHDRGDPGLQHPRELGNAIAALEVVVIELHLQHALLAHLTQRHLHCAEYADAVHGEGGGDLEGPTGVDAIAARAVLRLVPVAPADPVDAATVAVLWALVVVVHMDVCGPRVPVRVLHTHLCAAHATRLPAVSTKVVVALRGLRVAGHRHEVQLHVAAAADMGHVDSVAQDLAQQPQLCVLAAVVHIRIRNGARCAEISPTVEVRDNGPALRRHFHRRCTVPGCPPGGSNDRQWPVASEVELARARLVVQDVRLISASLVQKLRHDAVLLEPVVNHARHKALTGDLAGLLALGQLLEVAMLGLPVHGAGLAIDPGPAFRVRLTFVAAERGAEDVAHPVDAFSCVVLGVIHQCAAVAR